MRIKYRGKLLRKQKIRYKHSLILNDFSHEVSCEFENNARNYFLSAIDIFLLFCAYSWHVWLFNGTLKRWRVRTLARRTLTRHRGPISFAYRHLRLRTDDAYCSLLMILLSSPLLDFSNYNTQCASFFSKCKDINFEDAINEIIMTTICHISRKLIKFLFYWYQN